MSDDALPSAAEPHSVSFDIALEQQPFRLIELPPALLAHLESSTPQSLQLKSVPFPSSDATGVSHPAFLCSHDQTFEVRQVQSSNILYILQPSSTVPTAVGETDGNSNNGNAGGTGVTAIGQCKALLEAIPTKIKADEHVIQELPLFEGADTRDKSAEVKDVSREKVLSDAPFSEGEFDEAAKRVCAFEHNGTFWLPTATVLCDAWDSFMTVATIKGIKLQEAFEVEQLRLLVEEDGQEFRILQAVFKRLAERDAESMDGWTKLNEEACLGWIGGIVLESHGLQGFAQAELLREWQDKLPEAWRDNVSLDLLKDQYGEKDDGKLVSTSKVLQRQEAIHAAPQPVATKPINKWHEKFKANRK